MYIDKLKALIRQRFKTVIVYKFGFMSSIIITPIYLLLNYFIWITVFSNNPSTIKGYDFNQIMTYYIVIMLITHFIYNQVGSDLQQHILYGEFNNYMLKPVSILHQYLAHNIADRTLAFLVEVIPIFFITTLFFGLKTQLHLYLFFIPAMIFAFFINFFLSFLFALFGFWFDKSESLQWFLFCIILFLSGSFIPLEFFGSFFQILKFTPFFYIRYAVAQIFIGNYDILEVFKVLGIQVLWIIILYLICQFVLKKAIKKYGAVGG